MEPVFSLENIVMAVAGFLAIVFVKNLGKESKEAKEMANEANAKIHTIEVLVAGNYVRKEDHEKMTEAMFKKLDRIEEKLDDAPCRLGGHRPLRDKGV